MLRKIYGLNFERLVGNLPKALDPQAIVAECERLAMMIPVMASMQPGNQGDGSIANMVKEHFLTN